MFIDYCLAILTLLVIDSITCKVIVLEYIPLDTQGSLNKTGMCVMKTMKVILISVLIMFSLFSTWVMWQIGYSGIWLAGIDNPGSLQILLDLVIACSLICTWIYKDAKDRGSNPYPWMIGTVFAGSLVPLLYLIFRRQIQTHALQKNNKAVQV